MSAKNLLAEQFDHHRPQLRAVAYRMLGSLNEAEDAVQEAWMRLARSDASAVENLGGWLTTVVARLCLDSLRARKSRREEPLPELPLESDSGRESDPEQELLMADSVGLALLVVLDKLSPAERIAFVLHDMFELPFDEIAAVLGRSAASTRQLASRARRRVQGKGDASTTDAAAQRELIEAFLAASRDGDFGALMAVLDPDVVFRADAAAVHAGGESEMRGAEVVAKSFLGRAQAARAVLVDGVVGAVVAPRGRLFLALHFRIERGRIVGIEAVADPRRLGAMALAIFAG